jgi:hypothetical protein
MVAKVIAAPFAGLTSDLVTRVCDSKPWIDSPAGGFVLIPGKVLNGMRTSIAGDFRECVPDLKDRGSSCEAFKTGAFGTSASDESWGCDESRRFVSLVKRAIRPSAKAVRSTLDIDSEACLRGGETAAALKLLACLVGSIVGCSLVTKR